MKKFLISFVLIISLLFNVFADNKQAHKELREAFKNYGMLPEMVEEGFSLDKLDEMNDWKEMFDYLQPFFMSEDKMPLDNHAFICFGERSTGEYEAHHIYNESTMLIDWSDEYGKKDELLKKGYKEDEIFYYPYFNGEWRDGYRVGKKWMLVHDTDYGTGKWKSHFQQFSLRKDVITTKKSLYVPLSGFYDKEKNNKYYAEISKSNKKYLILDLSRNSGGLDEVYLGLVDAIKRMKPKETFILMSEYSFSYGDHACLLLEKDTNIKTTLIGYPTGGGYKTATGAYHEIQFDDFKITCTLGKKTGFKRIEVSTLVEGIGITPDYYANYKESIEVVKYLIKDDELVVY